MRRKKAIAKPKKSVHQNIRRIDRWREREREGDSKKNYGNKETSEYIGAWFRWFGLEYA